MPAAILVRQEIAATSIPPWAPADGFRHRGHAHGIPSQGTDGADLRRCFILGPRHIKIAALPQRNPFLPGTAKCQFPQPQSIHLGHVGKHRTEYSGKLSSGRAVRCQLDVIGNEHQLPRMKRGIHRPSRIGQDQGAHPQQKKHSDSVRGLFHGIAFIGMNAAGQHRRLPAGKAPAGQCACVTQCRGLGHMRKVFVGKHRRLFHLLFQAAQPGPQHQSNPRNRRSSLFQALPDNQGSFFIPVQRNGHAYPPFYNRTSSERWCSAVPAGTIRDPSNGNISRLPLTGETGHTPSYVSHTEADEVFRFC